MFGSMTETRGAEASSRESEGLKDRMAYQMK